MITVILDAGVECAEVLLKKQVEQSPFSSMVYAYDRELVNESDNVDDNVLLSEKKVNFPGSRGTSRGIKTSPQLIFHRNNPHHSSPSFTSLTIPRASTLRLLIQYIYLPRKCPFLNRHSSKSSITKSARARILPTYSLSKFPAAVTHLLHRGTILQFVLQEPYHRKKNIEGLPSTQTLDRSHRIKHRRKLVEYNVEKSTRRSKHSMATKLIMLQYQIIVSKRRRRDLPNFSAKAVQCVALKYSPRTKAAEAENSSSGRWWDHTLQNIISPKSRKCCIHHNSKFQS